MSQLTIYQNWNNPKLDFKLDINESQLDLDCSVEVKIHVLIGFYYMQ